MTFESFSDTLDSYDDDLSEERACLTLPRRHGWHTRTAEAGWERRCVAPPDRPWACRHGEHRQETAGARRPHGADGTARRRAVGEAGPLAGALGSHTGADAQPHAAVDRQPRRHHYAACTHAFPLGAGTEPERGDAWKAPRHTQTPGRAPAPRPGRPGRSPRGVSPGGVPPAGDAMEAAAVPEPGPHHRGLSRQSRADTPRVASPALRQLVSPGVRARESWGARLAVVTYAGGT